MTRLLNIVTKAAIEVSKSAKAGYISPEELLNLDKDEIVDVAWKLKNIVEKYQKESILFKLE